MKTLLFLTVFTLSLPVFANESTWICMKDGKAIEVKGETVDKKKAACEASSGLWTEEKAQAQSAGKGAGW